MSFVINIADINAAAERIKQFAIVTPMLEYAALNQLAGGRVLIKPECLQRTGSFKFRGAFNRLKALTVNQRGAGVVAWSSGNHAQAIAAASQILGIKATIVMPDDAPEIKTQNTLAYGAQVVSYDRYKEDREHIGREIAEQRRAVLVPSYDDPYVIAGQGTVGLELSQQLAEQKLIPDTLLVCCGGGGLIAGTATAATSRFKDCAIYSVEPAEFNDTERSLREGKRLSVDIKARSICDALLSPTPGELTFPINQHLLSGGISVTDDEVRNAMVYAFTTMKLITEPGGAVALAAVLAGKIETRGKVTAIVISGGNVDPQLYREILSSA